MTDIPPAPSERKRVLRLYLRALCGVPVKGKTKRKKGKSND